jgi:ribonucleoside-diphosphate reductase alpha chain
MSKENKFSENALFIMKKLYFKKDRDGNLIENTPEELFGRVSGFVCNAETDEAKKSELKKQVFNLMMQRKFMFSSPTLFNAGSDFSLASSCFVGGLEDSMEGIMKAASDTAITFKAGAGMGLNFGNLRPYGAPVGRGGTSSGPVSFMRLFNEVGETVKSGGVRRAAFMAMMDVNHPDIELFISSKDYLAELRRAYPELEVPETFVEDITASVSEVLSEVIHSEDILQTVLGNIRKILFEPLSNMNISVAITDKFMEAVRNSVEFVLDRHKAGGLVKKINAVELFHKIAQSAWRTADPGIWFIDRVNSFDTVPSIGRILSTNPCGEQSLHDYTSCNLGSINLNEFVGKDGFDYEAFKDTVRVAVRALDNVIDVAAFPTDDFAVNTRKIRPIGLGFTGLAETLFKLRIPYDSDEGVEFATNISRVMTQTAIIASSELAAEKGSFPLFEENKSSLIEVVKRYFDTDKERDDIESLIFKNGIRNSNWTTLAPTGSISLILDAFTYSLEPQFALAYHKNLIDGGSLIYVDPEFEKALNHDKKLIEKVAQNGGSCKGIKEIPSQIRRVFTVAHDISYDKRLEMQGSIQRYISNSISSTINLPAETTIEEIENIYLKAYELGLKGVTIYRDGCKHFQPMTTMKKKSSVAEAQKTRKWVRPKVLKAEIVKTRTGSGTLYTSLGMDEKGMPIELFINISKHGSEVSVFSEALGRVISIALQSGVPVDRIGDSIIGIVGDKPMWDNGKLIKSIPDAVGRILRSYAKKLETQSEDEGVKNLFDKGSDGVSAEIDYSNPVDIPGAEICPKCGEKTLARTEDCLSCLSCGYSKCG